MLFFTVKVDMSACVEVVETARVCVLLAIKSLSLYEIIKSSGLSCSKSGSRMSVLSVDLLLRINFTVIVNKDQ